MVRQAVGSIAHVIETAFPALYPRPKLEDETETKPPEPPPEPEPAPPPPPPPVAAKPTQAQAKGKTAAQAAAAAQAEAEAAAAAAAAAEAAAQAEQKPPEEVKPQRLPIYDERISKIKEALEQRLQGAAAAEAHLVEQFSAAEVAERELLQAMDREYSSAHRLTGAPTGQSLLRLDASILGGSGLIDPEALMRENERAVLRKTTMPPSTVIADEKEPGYLKTTKAYTSAIRSKAPAHNNAATAATFRMEGALADHEVDRTIERHIDGDGDEDGDSPAAAARTGAGRKPAITGEEKEMERRLLQRLQQRAAYVKNPRYEKDAVNEATGALGTSIVRGADAFQIRPAAAEFTDYEAGRVYEQTVEVVNVTKVSRRLRVTQPASPLFSVAVKRFPGAGPAGDGAVAPGMSVLLTVRFRPPTLEDADDEFAVATEFARLAVPLRGRRPPPRLTALPAAIDCGYALVGLAAEQTLELRNTGGPAAFRILVQNDEGEFVPVTLESALPFRVEPADFRLGTGEAVAVTLRYAPKAAGPTSRLFRLRYDNGTTHDFRLEGRAVAPHVRLLALAGVPPIESEGPVLRFGGLGPGDALTKTVVVQNDTPLPLPFAWSLAPADAPARALLAATSLPPPAPPEPAAPGAPARLAELAGATAEAPGFVVRPARGELAAEGTTEFTVTFRPDALQFFAAAATLRVQPPETAKPPSAAATGDLRARPPGVGPEIPPLAVRLEGSGLGAAVTLEPPLLPLAGTLTVGKALTRTLTLTNPGPSAARFEMRVPPPPGWQPPDARTRRKMLAEAADAAGPMGAVPREGTGARMPWEPTPDFEVAFEPRTGAVPPGASLAVALTIAATRPGALRGRVHCAVEHGEVLSVPIEGEAAGPALELAPPALDFGVVEVGTEKAGTLTLRNPFAAAIEWRLVRPSVPPPPGFGGTAEGTGAFAASLGASTARGGAGASTARAGGPAAAKSTGQMTGRSMTLGTASRRQLLAECDTRDDPEWPFLIAPVGGSIPPGRSATVSVTVRPHEEVPLRHIFEIYVKGGPTLYAAVSADGRAPKACVTPARVALEEVYRGVPVSGSVTVRNLSPFATVFEWARDPADERTAEDDAADPEGAPPARLAFEPQGGLLPPHGSVEVSYTLHPARAGPLELLRALVVAGMAAPLGFELTCEVRGLTVEYEVLGPSEPFVPHAPAPAVPPWMDREPLSSPRVTPPPSPREPAPAAPAPAPAPADPSPAAPAAPAPPTGEAGAPPAAPTPVPGPAAGQPAAAPATAATPTPTAPATPVPAPVPATPPVGPSPAPAAAPPEAAAEGAPAAEAPAPPPEGTAAEAAPEAASAPADAEGAAAAAAASSSSSARGTPEGKPGRDTPSESGPAVPTLDFGSDMPIFGKRTLRLQLRNGSGIGAPFKLFLERFKSAGDASTTSRLSLLNSRSALIAKHGEDEEEAKPAAGRPPHPPRSPSVNKGGPNPTLGASATGRPTSAGRMSVGSHKSGVSAGRTHASGATTSHRKHPILGDGHEYTDRFYSETGRDLIQTRNEAGVRREVLRGGRGVAFEVIPAEGFLEGHATAEVEVTCFADFCGLYEDALRCEVEGLPPALLPVRVAVRGSPLAVHPHTTGVHVPKGPAARTEPPSLSFGTLPAASGPLEKTFRVVNDGPFPMALRWHCFDHRPAPPPSLDVFLLDDDLRNPEGPYRLHVREHREVASKAPFRVEPPAALVPARGATTFTVRFEAGDGGAHLRHLVGTTALRPAAKGRWGRPADSQAALEGAPPESGREGSAEALPPAGEEAEAVAGYHQALAKGWRPLPGPGGAASIVPPPEPPPMPPILLDLKATTVLAALETGGKDKLTFVWMASEAPPAGQPPTRQLPLTNSTQAAMAFTLHLPEHFRLAAGPPAAPARAAGSAASLARAASPSATGPGADSPRAFVVGPHETIGLTLAFAPPAAVFAARDADDGLFEGDLVLAFANGAVQRLPLTGRVPRPELRPAPDVLRFGAVHVDNAAPLEVELTNPTQAEARWRIVHMDAADPAGSVYGSAGTEGPPSGRKKGRHAGHGKAGEGERSAAVIFHGYGAAGGGTAVRDDAAAFEFSAMSGVVPGRGQGQPQRVRLAVGFHPSLDANYRSLFRVVVEGGRGCSLLLKGSGTHREEAMLSEPLAVALA